MPPSTRPNVQITFDGKFSSPEGYNDSIVSSSYYWTLGDGATATGIRTTHTYTRIGIYTVTLKVQDSEGFWNTTSKQIHIGTILNRRTQVVYPTFQDAINNAVTGDTIYALSGTYYENVIVNRTVNLEGESKKTTIIDAKRAGYGVHVVADNVAVRNLTIRNTTDTSYAGIYIDHCKNAIIETNNLASNSYGIYLSYTSNDTVFGNSLVSNQRGIFLRNASYSSIYHNNFINTSISEIGFVAPASMGIVWDNGCEGNYWSSYNGADLDGDGIGETKLPWLGVDNYPLMNPYVLGDVNHDRVVDIFDVTWICVMYGAHTGDSDWNPQCDLVKDGLIDIFDITFVSICYGFVWSYP
jgi:parallel beta-helix repeat protein